MQLECRHCGAIVYAAPDVATERNRRTLECHVCDHVGFVPSFDDEIDEFDDDPPTERIPHETMAMLVFGANAATK
jgi:hypothetical protein